MKSIIHFHNNIFVKTAGLVILTLLTACYGVQSQFGKNGITQNKKVCFTGYINSNPARLFVREFQSVYGEHQIPDCDYLVYAMMTETSSPQMIMVGLEYFETQIFNVMYSVFRFDKDQQKIKKVQEIIDNPTIIQHETYTGSFGRGAIASRMNNPNRRTMFGVRSYGIAYQEDVRRFSKILKPIGGSSHSDSINTQKNPMVLTASTQAKEDAYEFIAKSLAQKVISHVGVYIDEDLNPKEIDDENTKDESDEIKQEQKNDDTDDIKFKVRQKSSTPSQQNTPKRTIKKISDVIK